MALQRLLWRIPKLFSTQLPIANCCSSFCRNENRLLVNDAIKRFCSSENALETNTQNNDRNIIFDKLKKEVEYDSENQKVFAVIHLAAQQFKVAENDIIMIQKKIEANCGDLIRLEKVLAVGCRNSTLVGMPILKREIANVQAMVMEKTKGEKKIAFKKKRRKGYKKWKGHRQDMSILKIKSIDIDTNCI